MNYDIYSERDRELSRKLFNEFGAAVAVTKSYIRQRIQIENQKSSYIFDLGSGNPQAKLPQNLLKLIDLFVANRVGIFLEKETDAKPGSGILQTYPNPTVFGAQAPDLETYYNAQLSILINQTQMYNSLDTHRFRFIPQTQQSATIANSEQSHNDAFIEMEPNLRFSGDQKNQIQIDIPSFPSINVESTTAGVTYYLNLYFNGFLVPNGAKLIGGK